MFKLINFIFALYLTCAHYCSALDNKPYGEYESSGYINNGWVLFYLNDNNNYYSNNQKRIPYYFSLGNSLRMIRGNIENIISSDYPKTDGDQLSFSLCYDSEEYRQLQLTFVKFGGHPSGQVDIRLDKKMPLKELLSRLQEFPEEILDENNMMYWTLERLYTFIED